MPKDLHPKIILYLLLSITLTSFGAAQSGIDVFAGGLDMHDNNIENLNELSNFFEQCENQDDAISVINDDGSVECVEIPDPDDTDDQNLSEVLEEGNVANQSINMSGEVIEEVKRLEFEFIEDSKGLEIGDAETDTGRGDDIAIGRGAEAHAGSTLSGTIAIGPDAEVELSEDSIAIGRNAHAGGGADNHIIAIGGSAKAEGDRSVVIGRDAEDEGNERSVVIGGGNNYVQGDNSVAVGHNSFVFNAEEGTALGSEAYVRGDQGIAIGRNSDADGDNSIALTPGGGGFATINAPADGAVAIGHEAIAPNDYEATFGNLQGEELDVNVTGDLTVHGDTTGIDVDTPELSEVLEEGNEADDFDIDMSGQDIEDLSELRFDEGVLIGEGSSTVDDADISIGDDSTVDGDGIGGIGIGEGASASSAAETFFGSFRSLAIGWEAEATTGDHGAGIAIGQEARASGPSTSFGGSEGSVAIGVGAGDTSSDSGVFIGEDASANGGWSTVIGATAESSGSSATALGYGADASDDSAALGRASNAEGQYSLALGNNAWANADNAVAIGWDAYAPNQYEATFGNLQGEELDVNVTGGATIHGDINASDIYYETLNAKSPVIQCQASSDWCHVVEPDKQDSYYVKTGEDFDKDRPKETAEIVSEEDRELVERMDRIKQENEELRDQIDEVTEIMCEIQPDAELCQPTP